MRKPKKITLIFTTPVNKFYFVKLQPVIGDDFTPIIPRKDVLHANELAYELGGEVHIAKIYLN